MMTKTEVFSTKVLDINSVLECHNLYSPGPICNTNFAKVSASTPGADCRSNGKCYTSVKYPYID